jgi:hypothetical protein
MEWFDRVLSVVVGFVGVILTSEFVHVDWQLVLASVRDATTGRWMPTFDVDVDLERLNAIKRMWS